MSNICRFSKTTGSWTEPFLSLTAVSVSDILLMGYFKCRLGFTDLKSWSSLSVTSCQINDRPLWPCCVKVTRLNDQNLLLHCPVCSLYDDLLKEYGTVLRNNLQFFICLLFYILVWTQFHKVSSRHQDGLRNRWMDRPSETSERMNCSGFCFW